MARIASNTTIVVISGVILTIPLYLWRIYYPLSDWAALALAPLALILFAGFQKPLAAMLRARSMATVRSDSWIFIFMTGRAKAAILSTVFVAVTVPILAWQALGATREMAFCLLALCLTANYITLGMPRLLQHHLHAPYATRYGVVLGAGIAALIFLPILTWINWSQITFPGEFRSLGIWDAVQFSVADRSPPRPSWIAEFLKPLYVIESIQLWFATNYGTSVWVTILYSIYLALVAFVIARASAALAWFAQSAVGNAEMTQQPSEHAKAQTGQPSRIRSNTAFLAFCGTLVLLAGATVGIALLGSLRPGDPDVTIIERELEPSIVEQVLTTSSTQTLQSVAPSIDRLLLEAYRPVYDAIPEYVNFHYSVRGEYTELFLAVQGQIGADLHERLFDGFEQRIKGTYSKLDEQYFEAFKSNLEAEIQSVMPEGAVLGEATQLALNDATDRAKVSYPVAGAAAIVGSGGLKALTAGMATKLGATIAAKAAAKGALKGSSVLAGAGGGAAICSWGGPLAVACGVGGGIAAWLLADAAIVNLDELINRDEFEAHLRELIDTDKAEKKKHIEEALREKAQQLDVIAEDYRLRDLPQTVFDN